MEMEGRRRRRFGPNQADFLDYTMLLNMNLTRRTVVRQGSQEFSQVPRRSVDWDTLHSLTYLAVCSLMLHKNAPQNKEGAYHGKT